MVEKPNNAKAHQSLQEDVNSHGGMQMNAMFNGKKKLSKWKGIPRQCMEIWPYNLPHMSSNHNKSEPHAVQTLGDLELRHMRAVDIDNMKV